jgi:hypothetical protein
MVSFVALTVQVGVRLQELVLKELAAERAKSHLAVVAAEFHQESGALLLMDYTDLQSWFRQKIHRLLVEPEAS